jgi:M6 family metalloprotease-like protein
MTRTRSLPAAVLLAATVTAVAASDRPEVAPPPRPGSDLTGYKTTKNAVRANPKEFNTAATPSGTAGYLGVVIGEKGGRPIIEAVEPDSPAEQAGLKEGDVIRKIGGGEVTTATGLKDVLRGLRAKDKLVLGVDRGGEAVEVTAVARAASSPLTGTATATGRVVMGVTLGGARPSGGVRLDEVTANGPAATAGLKAGDVVLKMDGKDVEGDTGFRDLLADKKPGDRVDVIAERDGNRIEARVFVTAEEEPRRGGGRGGPGGAGGWDDRLPNAWRKPSYKLAILGIEYPDVKHNPKITDGDWEASMFSAGTYTGKSATGQTVYGSMADYYKELSYGTFKVEGKFVGWVEVKKKRAEYSSGSGTDRREKTALLTESLDKYLEKNGKDALADYDGIFFLYAGGRVQTTRGGLYWPHRASVTHNGKRWPYFIVQEGGERMNDISVFCHEFGHMLGLPDLYARPEVPGMEGVGVWCAMSQQNGGGRPQHFCAWSKEQLGWVKPVIIDPRVKQKLVLAPIEDSPTECYKVMVKPDGSEYLLLENRKKTGWDTALPAEGLLIWRVMPGNVTQRVFLEEAHGIEGPTGPRSSPAHVPYPRRDGANNAFTPNTTPSSKSVTGGGLPVYITNIRKLPDGRITFHIGYEYQ